MVKNLLASAGDVRDVGSIPGLVRKIPWRRARHSTPVFLPGKIPWAEEPGRPMAHRVAKSASDITEVT